MKGYEVVVIGSGFGGAVLACRSAQQWPGEVLVLERGKRYPAGSFARTPDEMSANFWNADGDRRHRKSSAKTAYRHPEQRGLFDVRRFHQMDAVLAAGLGGGSLIYANVILEPPEAVFNDLRWPVSCTPPAMRDYYDVVRSVLGARPVPTANAGERRSPSPRCLRRRGGTAATAPTWWPPRRRNVTVHALGDCNLATTRAGGVVSSDPAHFGEVFGYQNLYVADGSIVPVSHPQPRAAQRCNP